jgi:outer membrane protein assembly factor BamD
VLVRGVVRTTPRNSPKWPLLLACLSLLLAACGGAQKGGTYGENAERDFGEAMENYEDEDCLAAEPLFRAVARNYPFSSYAALAELRAADCLAQQNQHVEAVQAFKQFARVRPSHEGVAYARFSAAESAFAQIPTEWLLSPPIFERDMRPARDALNEINRFLKDYTYDPRTEEATEMQRKTLKLLAKHELYVADYYLRREKPEAAVARIETMLRLYEQSGMAPAALMLMGRVQLAMRNVPEAHKTFRSLISNYPKSGMARQAERFLEATGG